MIRIRTGVTVLGCALLALPPAIGVAQADAPDCTAKKTARYLPSGKTIIVPNACFSPGERVTVGRHSLEVPDVGMGAGLYEATDGTEPPGDFTVENDSNVITVSRDTVLSGGTTGGPTACSDNAMTWSGNRNNGYSYYVNAAGLPSGVTQQNFEDEIALAHSTIKAGANDCGFAQNAYSVSITRKGSAGLGAMRTDGSCYTDGYNVIDFGYLPGTTLGLACTKWIIVPLADNRIYESDVRLRSSAGWFRTIPSGCSGKYEMAGVLTHELGHVFGMSHVAESAHAQQTMSENSTPCSYADRSLGRGDYNNMNTHY